MSQINLDLKKYWNKSFQQVSENKLPSDYAVKVESEFPRTAKICDLGGSSGVDALYFVSKGYEVTIVDISDAALDRAKLRAVAVGKANQLNTILDDYSDATISIAENTYDVVYARLSLHYFNRDTTKRLLAEINKKLKPQGKAYLTFKSPADTAELEHLKRTAKEVEPGIFAEEGIIKSRFTKDDLNQLLKEAGISNFAVKEIAEDFSGKNDSIKSGNNQLLLNEVRFTK